MLSFMVVCQVSSTSKPAMLVQGTRMLAYWNGYLTPMTQWILLQAPRLPSPLR